MLSIVLTNLHCQLNWSQKCLGTPLVCLWKGFQRGLTKRKSIMNVSDTVPWRECKKVNGVPAFSFPFVSIGHEMGGFPNPMTLASADWDKQP